MTSFAPIDEAVIEILYLICAVTFIIGLKRLSGPRTARSGNLLAAVGWTFAALRLRRPTVDVIAVLALNTLRMQAGDADPAALTVVGQALVAIHDQQVTIVARLAVDIPGPSAFDQVRLTSN